MLTENEPLLRLSVFAGIFVAMVLLELLIPRRRLRFDRLIRWPANLGITLLNTLLLRLVFPLAAVGFALSRSGEGLLAMLNLNSALLVIVSVVLLDLTIYAQHVAFHRIPILWRMHRMHHTDNDIDATTGLRFHPLEILASMLIKLAAIWVLGAPAAAVLIFELALNGGSLFNHSNIALPKRFDTILRSLIVTPDMHRVHHSTIPRETNSNFGFSLSVWDRLFGTYTAQPELGHTEMQIGLPETQTMEAQRIDRMLVVPFTDSKN